MKIVHSKYESDFTPTLYSYTKLETKTYRERLIVNKGKTFEILPVNEVACFEVSEKILFAIGFNQRKYFLNMSMKTLEEELNPKIFFRANRQVIINIGSIANYENYFNGRLVVKVKVQVSDKIVVSQKNVSKFKNWIDC